MENSVSRGTPFLQPCHQLCLCLQHHEFDARQIDLLDAMDSPEILLIASRYSTERGDAVPRLLSESVTDCFLNGAS